jgi:hypothetical protein
VEFDVQTTCQPSTVWCSRERLPAAAAQPAKVRQSCSATDYYFYIKNPQVVEFPDFSPSGMSVSFSVQERKSGQYGKNPDV